MLEEPDRLQITQEFTRVSAAQMARFQGAVLGNICDALGGEAALDPAIKPLAGLPSKLVGSALTLDCGPRDIMALVGALEHIQPGDVLVMATGGWQGCAAIGDLVTGMVANAGAVGIVTDGCVRDIEGIEAVGLPVYCTGINPNSPYTTGPGKIGHPVQIGGRRVASGDLICGSRDGVVVVPGAEVDAVADRVVEIAAAEAELEAKVKAGLTRL